MACKGVPYSPLLKPLWPCCRALGNTRPGEQQHAVVNNNGLLYTYLNKETVQCVASLLADIFCLVGYELYVRPRDFDRQTDCLQAGWQTDSKIRGMGKNAEGRSAGRNGDN